ncbi:hypothetical protein IIA79_01030 [bacterium]|nr:hypothetical protein [bacterium]
MPAQTGMLFLVDLHRRALADGRLHLASTAVVAALAGALSVVRLDEWSAPIIDSLGNAAAMAALFCGLWLGAGHFLLHHAREKCRGYITQVMLDTGLLYLVLEHEPGEALPSLMQQERLARITLRQGAGQTFQQRMLNFLRSYAACAAGLKLGLVDALHGEVEVGRPILTGG